MQALIKSMKYLYKPLFFFLVCFLMSGGVLAQVEVQQRVERYLYTNYTTNKTLLRENEQQVKVLEEKLDAYILTLDKEKQQQIREQEKEMNQYLARLEKVKDVKTLRQLVEETKSKQTANLDRFISKGLDSTQDALECHKIIIMKLAELELVSLKQEKLLALLKNDQSRFSFIQNMIKNTTVETTGDIKAFAQVVDNEVDTFEL